MKSERAWRHGRDADVTAGRQDTGFGGRAKLSVYTGRGAHDREGLRLEFEMSASGTGSSASADQGDLRECTPEARLAARAQAGDRAAFEALDCVRIDRPLALVLFTRQFAAVLNAGLPLVQCLQVLLENAQPPYSVVAGELRTAVDAGQPLSGHARQSQTVFNILCEACPRR